MDLDAYINENIDEIILNSNDYIGEYIIDKNLITRDKEISKDNEEDEDEDNYSRISGMYDDELEQYNNYSEEEYFHTDNYGENEDDDTQDIIGDLYQNMYEKKNFIKNQFDTKNTNQIDLNNKNEENEEIEENESNENYIGDDGYYYYNLMNIFIKYYNNKFDKIENFFVGVKDVNKDTSNQMELFFDAIIEYKIVKEKFNLDDKEIMEIIYDYENNSSKILKLFDEWDGQIYSFEYNDNKYISPSLIICLNYIYKNKLLDEDWNIYTMRNIE
jgi:hypothetical protein